MAIDGCRKKHFIVLNKDTPSISSDSLDPCYTSALLKNISNHIEKNDTARYSVCALKLVLGTTIRIQLQSCIRF